jgi:iron complex transport system substrate-binding protein
MIARMLLAGLCLLCGVAGAVDLKDDRGRPVALARPAARIVALAPHVAELVFAAGAGGKLVGVSAYSDYPAAAARIPLIGDFGRVDLERVLRLKPDLVIGWKSGNRAGDMEKLEQLGLPVFATEPRRLADIPRLLREIGMLAGTQGSAEQAAAAFENELAKLEARYRGARPVSVFYEIWHEPLMTLNDEHIIGDAIRLCGGRNIFGALSALTPTVSMENVLAADPEAIVASGSLYNDKRLLEAWKRFPQLRAVARGQLFQIHPDLIQRPTPRILQGVGVMCEQLETVRKAGGATSRPRAATVRPPPRPRG